MRLVSVEHPGDLRDIGQGGGYDVLDICHPLGKEVVEWVDEVEECAMRIDCIVNRDGRRFGFDALLRALPAHLHACGIDLQGTKVFVAGDAHAQALTRRLGAIIAPGNEAKFLVNGLEGTERFIDLDDFPRLETIIDIAPHVKRTALQFDARLRGARYCGGAWLAARLLDEKKRLYTREKPDEEKIFHLAQELVRKKRNIVLIGMPTSGKTTISSVFAREMGWKLIEMDDEIEKTMGMTITDCFAQKGEAFFRRLETQVAKDLRNASGCVISTGGGVIKNSENLRYLGENGLVAWLDRRIDQLFPSDSRPLSQSIDALRKMYAERQPVYRWLCDVRLDNTGTISDTVESLKTIAAGGAPWICG